MQIISSLEKVRYQDVPVKYTGSMSAFLGERISYQIAFKLNKGEAQQKRVFFQAEAKFGDVALRLVRHVPVRMAAYADADEDYISKEPGLYPDLLTPLQEHGTWAYASHWEELWVDVCANQPGLNTVCVRMMDEQENQLSECEQSICILNEHLPEQKLVHTKWFHADCLAEYYRMKTFGEEHWNCIERFVQCAVDHGINTILMPVHTPPLDTRVGGERLTTQLVQIEKVGNDYHFDMTNVRKWIALCKRCGVRFYEIAHLFTQWGAAHAPKIVARVDGAEKRIFGWETDAASEEYRRFLCAYIPALRDVFADEGIETNTIWHISDEPNESNLKSYHAARRSVSDLLNGCRIMDALSSFAFYQQGIVEHPIVANNHMEPFISANVQGLWTYYCCAQYKDVSNMFISMPSARNRAIAVQLYLYRIEGLLQWGYNFYNAQYSDYPIDPFATTDADGWVPAGDPFQVYPGANGVPLESIRLMVTEEALNDLRAFQMLEQLKDRETVVNLIQDGLDKPITFTDYPREAAWYLHLREKVNREIDAVSLQHE